MEMCHKEAPCHEHVKLNTCDDSYYEFWLAIFTYVQFAYTLLLCQSHDVQIVLRGFVSYKVLLGFMFISLSPVNTAFSCHTVELLFLD